MLCVSLCSLCSELDDEAHLLRGTYCSAVGTSASAGETRRPSSCVCSGGETVTCERIGAFCVHCAPDASQTGRDLLVKPSALVL